MRIMRFAGWLALSVGLLLGGLDGASAQGVDVQQACTPDAMRLCSEFIPDRGKTAACMMRKRGQLSAECRTAIGGGRGHGRRAPRHGTHHYHHHK
jgi:hypothetical protein